MPSENEARVRRYIDAWNRRDADGLLAELAPEAEYVNAPSAVEPGTRHGRNAVVTVAQIQWEMLVDGVSTIRELHDRGDVILAVVQVSRNMPASDARVETPGLLSFTFRDDKVIRLEVLGAGADFARATEAAGLGSDAG